MHDNCRVFPNGEGSYDLAISAEQDLGGKYSPNLLSKMTLSPENVNYTSDALINLMNNNRAINQMSRADVTHDDLPCPSGVAAATPGTPQTRRSATEPESLIFVLNHSIDHHRVIFMV